MRWLDMLTVGLAFVAGVDAAPSKGRRKGGKNVCQWAEARNPLIPVEVYITAEQESHLEGLIRGVARDIRTIHDNLKRGRMKRNWEKTKAHWDMMAVCVPTRHLFDVDNYVNGLKSIHESVGYLHSLTTKTKEKLPVRQAQYDIIDKNLRLIGLINDLHGEQELSPALIDRPQELINLITYELELDVTQPLSFFPSDPSYHGGRKKVLNNNKKNNHQHPATRD